MLYRIAVCFMMILGTVACQENNSGSVVTTETDASNDDASGASDTSEDTEPADISDSSNADLPSDSNSEDAPPDTNIDTSEPNDTALAQPLEACESDDQCADNSACVGTSCLATDNAVGVCAPPDRSSCGCGAAWQDCTTTGTTCLSTGCEAPSVCVTPEEMQDICSRDDTGCFLCPWCDGELCTEVPPPDCATSTAVRRYTQEWLGCDAGTCTFASETVPCQRGEICTEGACVPEPLGESALCCSDDSDCDSGSGCIDAQCWEQGSPCAQDDDCDQDEGLSCGEDGRCVQRAICQCASDEDCPSDPDHLCITSDLLCGICIPKQSVCTNADQRCASAPLYGLAFQPESAVAEGEWSWEGTITEFDERSLTLSVDGVATRFSLSLPTVPEGSTPYSLDLSVGSRARIDHFYQITNFETSIVGGAWTVLTIDGLLTFAVARNVPLPTRYQGGWNASVEDAGCSFGDIGQCIQTRWSALLLTKDESALVLFHGEQATIVAEDGALQVVSTHTFIDENSCQDPETHGPRMTYMLLRP